jgi:hypothetical protein
VQTDVYIINGLPIPETFWTEIVGRYRRILTIEDGLIGNLESGLRGFAALASSHLGATGVELRHFGITDPRIAPSDHFVQVWEHFQMTEETLVATVLSD